MNTKTTTTLAALCVASLTTPALAGILQPTIISEFSDSGTFSHQTPYGESVGFVIDTPYDSFDFLVEFATEPFEDIHMSLDPHRFSQTLVPTPPFTQHGIDSAHDANASVMPEGPEFDEGWELRAYSEEWMSIGQTFDIQKIVTARVEWSMNFDGVNTVTVAGTWSYEGGEYHWGTDPRPATTAVPEAGATLPALGLGLLGLIWARRKA